MSSIFTFQDELPRIQSPWSTPGNATPQPSHMLSSGGGPTGSTDAKSRLEPEKQDGPCEYKLHLLLRARRHFVSMSTTPVGNMTAPLRLPAVTSLSTSGRSLSETLLQRSSYQPSSQTRQARLQQLTTQLLWRLQQSSPFHSSSNAELVLPVLPEATPRLGVPERPDKLLPGLEESQGALYEIGVADDGTLVGLIEDELEESLNNLRAMAASLGCVVDILRKVVVGTSVWIDASGEHESVQREGDLSVAEVLVRPDTRSQPTQNVGGNELQARSLQSEEPRLVSATEQLRVALIGPTAVGKSSLLGTLTTSSPDNGRGKSRLSLLKHRHEITSGITSSVAHELLGYKLNDRSSDFVINYSSGDVSTWTDIHGLADRLCFAIDSPGLSRFAKSAYRALISWKPDWTFVCVAADDDEAGATSQSSVDDMTLDTSLAHLELCLKLGIRIVVVVTKMDLAAKTRLRTILAKILTFVKNAGKKPLMLSVAAAPTPAFSLDSADSVPDLQHVNAEESAEIDRMTNTLRSEAEVMSVPIIMTSTVSGSGIGKLHRLLSRLPLKAAGLGHTIEGDGSVFQVDEVFSIPPVRIYNAESEARSDPPTGVVLCGQVEHGAIRVGDKMFLGPFSAAPTTKPVPRSKSLSAQDLRRLSLSADQIPFMVNDHNATQVPSNGFVSVRVVSLRNLRLPVRELSSGDVGTIGVETVDHRQSLQRARKGMVLSSADLSSTASQSIVASFPASDFLVASPPLILGGHATVYFNSVRAAIKVVALALVEDDALSSSPTLGAEMFAFDDDDDDDHASQREGPLQKSQRTVSITMRFVNTVEFVRNGDQVLVVPTFSAAGPVAGPVAAAGGGLTGFVGRVVGTIP